MIVNTGILARVIAAQEDTKIADTKKILYTFLDEISLALTRGDEVSLPEFGKFKVKNLPARTGVNPASRKVQFRPAKVLKDRVNG